MVLYYYIIISSVYARSLGLIWRFTEAKNLARQSNLKDYLVQEREHSAAQRANATAFSIASQCSNALYKA